jgi:hypothetical protein
MFLKWRILKKNSEKNLKITLKNICKTADIKENNAENARKTAYILKKLKKYFA